MANIFLYSKSKENTFNEIRVPIDKNRKRNLVEMVDGKKVSKRNEHGEIIYKEQTDKPITDVWIINRVGNTAKERLGYPTQKPEELLQRIITASSNEGDLVADFFCGCGTTISVAQELKRHWLGVDISHLAIGLIERRLIASYGKEIKNTYTIDGFPKDIASAKQLSEQIEGGRFKFQDWIIEAMLGGIHNPKKTADGGWDGHMTFEITPNKKEIIYIEVKSGNVNVKNLREFIHVVNKQNGAMGLFVCFQEQVTKPMIIEAKDAGYLYYSDRIDKIQIVTVENLMNGIHPKVPNSIFQTFKMAQRKSLSDGSEQQKFELE